MLIAAPPPVFRAMGQSPHTARMLRFAVVGASGAAVNSVSLLIIHGRLHVPLIAAAAASAEVATLMNFALNDRWTFCSCVTRLHWATRAVRFNAVALGGVLVSLAVLAAFVAVAGERFYLLANAVGIAAGGAWNYAAGYRLAWSPRAPARVVGALLSEGRIVFCMALTAYVALAVWLILDVGVIVGDGLSRTANAYYMIFSRDPHLGAVGFVWNPLPSLAQVPLLMFKDLWPPLTHSGFAGGLMSAAFMAGAVYELNRALLEMRVSRAPRLALTVMFALHPLILYYAANGLSEAPLLFFLVLTTRCLLRWSRTGQIAPLAGAGAALAGAYLTRYEAAAAAGGVILAVATFTFLRSAEPPRRRAAAAACDGFIVAAPFLLAFVGWSAASYLLVHSPFEQFTSVYGNSSQVAAAGVTHISAASGLGRAFSLALHLQPMAVLVMLGAIFLTGRRRDASGLLIISVFVPVLAFMAFTFALGLTLQWLRYLIAVIPLTVLLTGAMVAPRRVRQQQPSRPQWWRKTVATVLPLGVALTLVLPGLPVAAWTMHDANLAGYETSDLRPVLGWGGSSNQIARQAEEAAAKYVDGLQLRHGAVLVDTFNGFPIVLASRNAQQFVITSDRDFGSMLADPFDMRVQYMLVPAPVGLARFDALNRAYPTLFDSGAGFTSLVHEFRSGSANWRLYQVVGPPHE